MKKILITVGQFILFLALFGFGSVTNPLHMHWTLASTPTVEHYFVPDGLLLALGVFVAILVVQAIRNRTCDTPWTIVAFLAAVAIGYFMKFGFATHDLI